MVCHSSFPGPIAEIPGISVDNFEHQNLQSRAFFLSHTHMDHTRGLYDSVLKKTLRKTNAKIYTTELSAYVIKEQWDDEYFDYIEILPLGTTLITLPNTEDNEELLLTVTCIPAGHSLGSIMLLFNYLNQNILYTGDFRITPNDISKYGYLHNQDKVINIDVLYIDTTFQFSHENFPKRSESIEQVLDEIDFGLKSGRVALRTSARYGYECIYNEIYKRFGLRVYVSDDRWKFYSKIKHLVPGVTNDKNCQLIHLCENKNEKHTHDNCLNTKCDINCLFIFFSAMRWDKYKRGGSLLTKVSKNRINVCFATHCSYNELIYFVDYLKPNKVVGFPNKFLKNEIVENVCRKRKMVDGKVCPEKLKDMFDM